MTELTIITDVYCPSCKQKLDYADILECWIDPDNKVAGEPAVVRLRCHCHSCGIRWEWEYRWGGWHRLSEDGKDYHGTEIELPPNPNIGDRVTDLERRVRWLEGKRRGDEPLAVEKWDGQCNVCDKYTEHDLRFYHDRLVIHCNDCKATRVHKGNERWGAPDAEFPGPFTLKGGR